MTDPGQVEGNNGADGQPRTQWGLFRLDPESGEPIEPLDGMHAEVNSSDPTHRQSRPKPELLD